MTIEPKVDFVIGGTQKGGTTALDTFLREHPQISMAKKKEVHFFDNERFFRGEPKFQNYHSFFDFNFKSYGVVVGESTPIYMYWQRAPERIFQYNQNVKWIILLRNPVERAFSHWNMQRNRGIDRLDFLAAIENEKKRGKKSLPYQQRLFSYVDRGFYSRQLRRIFDFFPKNQVLVQKSEDLRERPNQVLRNIGRFLGIDEPKEIKPKIIHSRPYSRTMSSRERKVLESIYAEEIGILEIMLGLDLSRWLEEGDRASRSSGDLVEMELHFSE